MDPSTPSPHNRPLPLKQVSITDAFWGAEQELVRTEVIPYQWNALNDAVPGAAPSYCMHNFKAAARQNAARSHADHGFVPPTYTYRGFEALPEDPEHPDPDTFYGFVFQDTDFSKWIEAVGYTLAHHPDADLEATADAAIDIVCAAQLDNGYLDTYYILNGMDRHFTYLRDHHELYCLGHLIEGAIAYHQGTGKRKLLDAACRFADYVDSVFGRDSGKLRGYPGHEIAEMALARLYETTGEQRYLHLAEYFVTERGRQPLYFEQEDRIRADRDGMPYIPNRNVPMPYAYYQAHQPVVEQSEAVGHAVRAVYLYSGAADVARLTGNANLTAACERLWRSIVDRKLYVTGGIGGTHIGESFSYDYDLPNDTAYSETCAAIGLVFLARRMLELEPVAEYADVMEAALYNTVLAGMALDGRSFFYVNPLEVDPVACRRDERKFHVKPVRQKWFGCACCPPNIARLVESIQQYVYTVSDDSSTLFTHLYIGSEADVTLNGRRMRLEMSSNLPWHGDGRATVHIDDARCAAPATTTATLAFRLPQWAGGQDAAAAIRVIDRNGATIADDAGVADAGADAGAADAGIDATDATVTSVTVTDTAVTDAGSTAPDATDTGDAANRISREVRDGYLYLSGTWHDGDAIVFDFPMPVRMLAANPRVREDAGKVAFVRGPVTFCAEGIDNGADLHLLHVDAERIAAHPDCVRVDDIVFHAGAEGMDESGLGEVDAVDRPMVRITVPGWHEVDDSTLSDSTEHTDSAEKPTTGAAASTAATASAGHHTSTPLYHPWIPAHREPVSVTLIPYFAWANRGENEMTVWLRA